MSKQDLLRIQSCILKVNIHCSGCEQKVKKLLHKVHGVYSVRVDADEGMVVVTGDVDPSKLVKKLKRGGKHAEIWGGQKGMMYNQSYPINNNHQFQNLQLNGGKGGKDNHKGQKGHGGGGHGQLPHFQNIKGAQDLKVHANAKQNKSVKFNLSDEEFDGGNNGFDEYDEEEGYAHGHAMHNRTMPMMGDGRGPAGMINEPNRNSLKGNGGGGGHRGGAKKGDVIDQAVLLKGKGGNYNEATNGNMVVKKSSGDQNGKSKEAKHKEGDNGKQKNAKSDGGLLGRFLGFGKKSKKREESTHTNKNKNNSSWGGNNVGRKGKKDGGKFEEHSSSIKSKNDLDFLVYDDIYPNIKNGKSSKGSNGNGNVGPMGNNRMGNIPATSGGGYCQGMQMQSAPYNLQQQQYMGMMMDPQQQHHGNMNDMYPTPMMYGRPHPSMNYMPPPPMPSHPMADPIAHTFSDENVESCSIM